MYLFYFYGDLKGVYKKRAASKSGSCEDILDSANDGPFVPQVLFKAVKMQTQIFPLIYSCHLQFLLSQES